jgi:hypothetical protein
MIGARVGHRYRENVLARHSMRRFRKQAARETSILQMLMQPEEANGAKLTFSKAMICVELDLVEATSMADGFLAVTP